MPPIDCQKAVVVSDVHLGYSRADSDAFLKFIDSYPGWNDTDRFILIGDIFDFWRRQNAKLLVENQLIIERILSRPCKVTFLRGNHDYYLEDLVDRFYDSTHSESRNFEVAKTLSIRSGQRNFFLMHGYEFEVFSSSFLEPLGLGAYEDFSRVMCMSEDISGGIASSIWEIIAGLHTEIRKFKHKFETLLKPAEERELEFIDQVAKSNARNILLGLPKGDVLVFGHTHRAFKDTDAINTGSWIVGEDKKSHTYVEIDSGSFELGEVEQTKEKVQLVRLEMAKARAAQRRKTRLKK